MKSKMISFKEGASYSFLSLLETVADPETKAMIIDMMSEVTKGGELFSGELRKNISRSIAKVVKEQIPPQISIQSPQSITFSPSEENDFEEDDIGKTPEEVILTL